MLTHFYLMRMLVWMAVGWLYIITLVSKSGPMQDSITMTTADIRVSGTKYDDDDKKQ